MAVISDHWPEIDVTLVDIDKNKISAWNNSDLTNLPIYEPGLKEVVKRNRNRNLFFSTNIQESISEAEMIFISVNTPTKLSGMGAGYASDLKWVESSARQVAKYAKGHTIIVEKSTVPVKTAELIKEILINSENNELDKKTGNKNSFQLVSHVKDRPAHDRLYLINPIKSIKDLNWKPDLKLKDNISATIDWYLDNKIWISTVTKSSNYNLLRQGKK